MPRQISIARRNLLKGAGALAAGMALQRAHLTGAQDASPTAEPEEVTYSQPVEGKTNVSWWTINNPSWVDGNIKMITAFQEANPDINIVYQYFPYEVLISKLQAGYNSGTVADMQQMFGTWVTDYAAFGLLDPVPAESGRGLRRPLLGGVDRGVHATTSQYYGMPKEFNLENGGMLVNPEIVEADGIPEQPGTWQELIDNAVKATKYDDQNRITQAGFMFTGNDPINFLFLAMILQQGATYWADDGVHVNFQTDAAKKAWQDEVDLVAKYHVDDETSYAGQDINFFFQGHAAYAMKGPWVIPEGAEELPRHEVHLRPHAAVRGDRQRLRRRVGLGRGGERQRRAGDQGRGLEVHRLHDAAGQPARVESFHVHPAVAEVDAERPGHPRGRAAAQGLLRRPALRQVGGAGAQPRPLLAVDS